MGTNIIPIEYEKILIFKGTEDGLSKRVKSIVAFDKFYTVVLFVSLIFSGYAIIHWDVFLSVFWEKVFIGILIIAFSFLVWATVKGKTFNSFNRIKKFTFVISNVEVTENGKMFVDAYKAEDIGKVSKYRFYFDTYFEFPYDFFTLYQVMLNGYENFYYCRKRVK